MFGLLDIHFSSHCKPTTQLDLISPKLLPPTSSTIYLEAWEINFALAPLNHDGGLLPYTYLHLINNNKYSSVSVLEESGNNF